MNFLEEINNFVLDEFGTTVNDYRYVVINGKYFYLEGHNGIKILTDKEISFAVKKKVISIKGTDLKVKYFDNSTAVILGTIVQVMII